jgi:hypothetical protein
MSLGLRGRVVAVLLCPLLLGNSRACWTESIDAVASLDNATVYSAITYDDVNFDGAYSVGVDTLLPNSPVTVEVALVGRDGLRTILVAQPAVSDANGYVKFDASSFMTQAGLYQLAIRNSRGLQSGIIRQFVPRVLRSGSPTADQYCVAYAHVFARKVAHSRLSRANYLGLSSFQGLGYVFAGADLVEASALAALQRNLGGVKVTFRREGSPSYVPGQTITLGAPCATDSNCAPTEMCELVFPPDAPVQSQRCVEVSSCALRPRNGFYRRHVEFATGGDGSSSAACGRSVVRGLKAQAALDELNLNLTSGEPAFVYIDRTDTLETVGLSPSDRSVRDAVEDLGRALGFSASHEVGHTLGLVSARYLRGSEGPRQIGEVIVGGAEHPDLLDYVTAGLRVPSRAFLVSGSDPLRLVPSNLARSETEQLPRSCSLSPIRVPASFGEFNASFLDLAVPGP